MNFKGAVLSGPVSRSPETIKEHRLLRDRHSTKENFLNLVKKDSEKIIKAQKHFAFVSAGQLDWLDLLRSLAFSFKGFEKRDSKGEDVIGPVTRWYATNTFYRKPTISEKISVQGKELAEAVPKTENGILFLLGPYSFFRLTKNSFYNKGKELALDYSKAIAENAGALKEKGYTAVLFSEPSFGFDLQKEQFSGEGFWNGFAEPIKEKGMIVGVNFPLADAVKALPLVENTGFDFIGIDCIYSDLSGIKTEKDLLLGIVDGSRIGIESSETIKNTVEKFRKESGFTGNYYIGPNDRLFDVPFEQGLEKIKSLAKAAEELKRD